MKTSEVKIMNELHRLGFTFEKALDLLPELMTIRRLAKKHHRLAEMACNGEGWINGKLYSWNAGQATYGYMAAYKPNEGLGEDVTVFDVESDKVEAKIKALAEKIGFRVEFQGDPRGNTVKLFFKDQFVEVF